MRSLLAKRYDMDHFSIGEELRSLMLSNMTGHLAHIKCKPSMAELKDLARNARTGTLDPSNLTPKYAMEHILPAEVDPDHARILIEGFRRRIDR